MPKGVRVAQRGQCPTHGAYHTPRCGPCAAASMRRLYWTRQHEQAWRDLSEAHPLQGGTAAGWIAAYDRLCAIKPAYRAAMRG